VAKARYWLGPPNADFVLVFEDPQATPKSQRSGTEQNMARDCSRVISEIAALQNTYWKILLDRQESQLVTIVCHVSEDLMNISTTSGHSTEVLTTRRTHRNGQSS